MTFFTQKISKNACNRLIYSGQHYPFGVLLDERGGDGGYRYGFNGMEKDGEVSGNGNSYTTQFRQYDPRLGRWKSLDPLMGKFPWMSPYVGYDNNPVYYTDPLGLCTDCDEGGEESGKDDVLEGQQRKDGTWNGEQNVEEVTISYDRTSGKVIPPPTPEKVGNYSMTVLINGTEFKKDKLDYKTAHDFQSDFYNQLNELRARQLNNKSGWAPLAGPVYDTKVGSIVPDAISIDFEGSAYVGPGTNVKLSFVWIIKGENASFFPIGVLTATAGLGYDVSGGAGLSVYYKYKGDLDPFDFQTPLQAPLYMRGISSNYGVGLVGIGNSYTPIIGGSTSNHINSYSVGINAQVSGVGFSSGIPNSVLLW